MYRDEKLYKDLLRILHKRFLSMRKTQMSRLLKDEFECEIKECRTTTVSRYYDVFVFKNPLSYKKLPAFF